MNRARWRVGVGEIAVRVMQIWLPPFMGINPDQNWTADDENCAIKGLVSSLNTSETQSCLTLSFNQSNSFYKIF